MDRLHKTAQPSSDVEMKGAATGADETWDDEPLYASSDSAVQKRSDRHTPSRLEQTDLAQLFGVDGPLARHLEGYELRPTQLEMAEAVKRALLAERHALIEAPTGTGKSIAYLIPALLSGKTVVIATANKSLQSQLYDKDIPFLRQVLNQSIEAVVVKGRSNYVCSYKWEQESFEQQRFAFQDREHAQITFLRNWLEETDTGDVDDLPFMLNSDLRPRIVSFTDDCLHTDCRHYHDNCWIVKMRERAAQSRVLITNHHLLLNALELGGMGERILPPAAVYVIDEAHQLEQTATSVYEANVTDHTVAQLLNRAAINEFADADEVDAIKWQNTTAFQEIAHSSRDNAFRIEGELEELKKLAHSLSDLAQTMQRHSPYVEPGAEKVEKSTSSESSVDSADAESEKRRAFEMALETLNSTANKLLLLATSKYDDSFVRYAVRVFDRRHITLELHAAPINPALMLHEHLFHPEPPDGPDGSAADGHAENAEPSARRTVICTSATLATNGHFEHFKTRCGIGETGEEFVLPAIFDYPTQTLLYQPVLPAYNWRNADRFYSAVTDEIARLLEASRGRALCLFTSWNGLQQVRAQLRDAENEPIWPLRAQGDAPRDALLRWFKETRHSVLLATKSFWEGVDIPGDDLSLVVLDKLPFPTPSDPLHSARMQKIDEEGRSSFGEYMLPLMTLNLKQGFGRLVRRSSDRGVVAILDERLSSRSYGRRARQDLPPARFSRAFRDVHQFFRGALSSQADFALNLWAENVDAAHEPDAPPGDVEDDPTAAVSVRWQWQLLRLQDGKADTDMGVDHHTGTDLTATQAGELHAALRGLHNLHERIENAGRDPDQFGVEVRCTAETAALLQATQSANPLVQQWIGLRSCWKTVDIIGLLRYDASASEE